MSIKTGGLAALVLALAGVVYADDKVEAKGAKVDYEIHTGHFEKNNAGLKGDA